MAFIHVPERRAQRALGRLAASLIVVVGRRGKRSYALRLIIGKALAQERGWDSETRIRVAWGSGEDFGWLKIETAGNGRGRKLTGQRHHLVTDFRTLPIGNLGDDEGAAWRLLDKSQPAADCRYRDLPDGAIAAQLPNDWFELVRPAARRTFRVV